MTRDSEESVLLRWSRRKLESKQALAEDARQALEAGVEPATPVATDSGKEEAADEQKPVLTDADMPDIETLTEDSDFSPFMSAGVSDELRNLALRKLFRAPVFNIRDGLDEYDEDYTSFEKLGDIVTCDMKHRIEMEEQKLREKLAREAQEAGEDMDALEEIDASEEIEDIEDDGAPAAEQVAAADNENPERQDPQHE
jgi:hypothetical protein